MTQGEDLRSLLRGIVRETVAADVSEVEVWTRVYVEGVRVEVDGVHIEFTMSHSGMSKLTPDAAEAGARLRAPVATTGAVTPGGSGGNHGSGDTAGSGEHG